MARRCHPCESRRFSDGRRSRRPRPRRRGFTLLETMLTLVIVSVGVASVFDAYMSFNTTNEWSTHSATAAFLAGEIRELTRNLPKHDPVTGLGFADDPDAGAVLIGWGTEPGEVTPRDFDDLDDFDGISFTFDATLASPDDDSIGANEMPGPIDAAGFTISDYAGHADTGGQAQVRFGWIQTVFVDKVDPFNLTTLLDPGYTEAANGLFPGREVDDFPVRVTVEVSYMGPYDTAPRMIGRTSWVVP